MLETRQLTCCFRCPRRVIFLASQINRGLRAAPGAANGDIRVAKVQPSLLFPMLEDAVKQGVRTLFVSRGNHVLLSLLRQMFEARRGRTPTPGDLQVRWLSPSVQRLVQRIREEGAGRTLAQYVAGIRQQEQGGGVSPDRTLQRILEVAVALEGPGCPVWASAWLATLARVLTDEADDAATTASGDDTEPPVLHVATVHAIKGMEFPHVIGPRRTGRPAGASGAPSGSTTSSAIRPETTATRPARRTTCCTLTQDGPFPVGGGGRKKKRPAPPSPAAPGA